MRSLALLLALVPAAGSAATDLEAKSRVDAVTVYLSSARVTRAAHVDLPAGEVRLLLEGAPSQLVDESLRVTGKGQAHARVFGVSVEPEPHVETPAPDAKAAQDKLQKLEDQRRALDDELAQAKARQGFVDSLRSTYSEERAKNLAVRPVDVKELAAMADFVAKQTGAVKDAERKTGIALRELQKQVEAARQELAKIQAKGGKVTKTIAVELRVEKPGPFDLAVSYLVPSASWSPVWDARLDPDQGAVAMTLYGSVQQSSGEDWDDVELAVSTTQPYRGLYVPELNPQYLDKYVPQPVSGYGGGRGMAPAAAPMPVAQAARPGSMMEKDEEEKPQEVALEAPAAAVSEGLLSTTFTAPRRETIEGTGKARRSFLATWEVKGDVQRTIAAKIEQAAFLTVKAVNTTGVPFLAGPANVFLGDEFVGRTRLALVPAGDDLKLAFGADDRVKVKREVLDRKHDTQGLLSKEEVMRYRIRTTVKNLYARRVAVTLFDQVPVSRDGDVKVKVLDGSTAPNQPGDPMKPGVRTHELTLAPRAEQAIELRYEVRWPHGQLVNGLE